MASQQQSSSVWLPGVVLLAIAGTSYLVHETAYQTSRPVETKTRSRQLLVPDDVDARLWQDPVYALDQHLRGEESGADHSHVTSNHHKAEALRKEISERLKQLPPPVSKGKVLSGPKPGDARAAAAPADGTQQPQPLTLLAVMVPDAPYAEPAERRRRIRYAVLSGLNRSGLVPEDQEHISFFAHHSVDDIGRPKIEYIPYELLQHTGSPKPRSKNNAKGKSNGVGPAVVLWIPTEGSRRCAQAWLSSIFADIASQDPRLRFIVLGPPESGTLAEMVREAITLKRCQDKATAPKLQSWVQDRMQFYSPWASAAGKELAYSLQDDLNRIRPLPEELKPCVLNPPDPSPPTQECDIEEILKIRKPHVHLVRLIGDDVLLSNALLQELELRGVDPACASRRPADPDDCFGGGLNRHRIAIVSEWDAPYQRALRWTLARSIQDRCDRRYKQDSACVPSAADKYKDWLIRFSYLRGLDGQIADAPDTNVRREDDTRAKSKDPSQPFGEIDTVERADGNTQFDYVRRLVEQIENKDRELQDAGESSIGAIGVLGTDPYDKLTILQALHARFADKIFFTTNLDARLIHPRESKWARNLVVVSAFDLELNQDLQRDIPPLRDGYQTAAFFAAQFAIRDGDFDQSYQEVRNVRCKASATYGQPCSSYSPVRVARSWFVPLVFEIARTRAIRLEHVPELSAQNDQECDRKWDFSCIEVQPRVEPTAPYIRQALRGVSALATGLAIALAGMLLIQAAKPRQPVSSAEAYSALRMRVALVVVLAVLGAGIALSWNSIWSFLTEDGMGEPGAVFEGVSIWPAQGIRLLIVGLAVAFMFHSHARLASNRKDIVDRFRLSALDESGAGDIASKPDAASLGALLRAHINRWLLTIWLCVKETTSMRPPVDPGDVESLWTHYLHDGRACARLCRVFFFGLLLTALSAAAFLIWPDVARFRGERSYEINRFIFMGCVLTFNLLLFYVVDALIICNRCIKRLISGLDWPLASYAKFRQDLGEGTPLKEWMTVQFIASRTDAVGSLVYLPFILLFLIIMARNSVFERWSLTPSVVVLLSVSTLIIVFAAIRLRETTESGRAHVLQSLTDQLIVAKGAGNDKLVRQLELMINEVREVRRGAFAPYTDQKFIRALLLPLAGFASTALIEYLSLVKP
jgi:hypothetical protein